MQYLPKMRPLPLLLACLFSVSSAYSAQPQDETGANQAILVADSSSNAGSLNTAPVDTEQISTVEVKAAHLKSARIDMAPKVGTTVYSIDKHMVEMLGQGDSTPFNEIMLRLPGVAQDSKASGSLHVRDDHGNVQYRVNGVQLPEGISGFGQSIDSRQIDQTDFLTGALPAQYGLRTAGIIDIQTKEGHTKPGGRLGILFGSHSYAMPSAEFFGTQGNFNYYFSGSYLSNNIGIENPTPASSAIHDKTEQTKSFGNMSYYLDDSSRLGLMFGTYFGKFQVPNNPNQTPGFSLTGVSDMVAGTSSLPSAQLNENQNERNRFVILSYQKNLGDLNYQISGFNQYSELHFQPDTVGDLVYNGVATNALRSSMSNGIQADLSYKLNLAHTVRAGFGYTRQKTESNNNVSVFATDNSGAQVGNDPFIISDNNSKTGSTSSFYLQDEWHVLTPLTINFGIRFDKVSAYIDEQQWSPRLNMLYKLNEATAFHAGYSRYFTPPPQELTAQSSINKFANTTNAPEVTTSDSVKAERTHYFDAGISHQFNDNFSVTADAYYKKISNLLDEGQFGQALILTPFNYERGFAKGLELSAVYNEKNWGGFLNFTVQKAMGSNIISGQSVFGAKELAYIASHDIYLDHDQTYTLSGGAHYHFGESKLSADFLYGSGLRKTPVGGAPNSGTLDAYTTVNAAYTYNFKKTSIGDIELRLAMINLFDKSYLIRDGSGVGVGAPQYGPRRTLYVGFSTAF